MPMTPAERLALVQDLTTAPVSPKLERLLEVVDGMRKNPNAAVSRADVLDALEAVAADLAGRVVGVSAELILPDPRTGLPRERR